MQPDTEIAISIAKTPKRALQIALSKLTTSLNIPEKGIDKVIIKPSIYNPEYVGNTNPDLIHAIAVAFSSIAPIAIVESDNPIRRTKHAFEKAGYTTRFNNIADLVDLSTEQGREAHICGRK